jgi:2-keto-4-pentenoate hydratase/2-oxohepta-3-ene-1,7-dioic acid hydratase in catechol pathway
MKLVRFGPPGAEKPGLVDGDGAIRDLSAHVGDFDGTGLAQASLDQLRRLDPKSLPLAPADVRLGAPVGGTRNFIAVGLNFADHAKETKQDIPAEPILFSKAPNCIVGAYDDVMYPKNATNMDWEVEIAFVVGTRARYVEQKDAMAHIAGFCICNDLSERRFQVKRAGQWLKGKSAETFGPLGPWLVTPDEIADVQNLSMTLDVNGVRKQTGSTKTMIFSIPFLLAYVTEFMVLDPGDVVTTGTPPGVGSAREPREYLKAGDVMTLRIDGLGEQRQTVVPFMP